MARIFIREKPNGFYVMTYKGVQSGPYKTYAAANKSTTSLVRPKSKRKSPSRKRLARYDCIF